MTMWDRRTAYSVVEDWPGALSDAEYTRPWTVLYGHDGGVGWPHDTDLTADVMRELCDMMIDRWTRFRASLDAAP
jgi:hypothetical protein